MGNLEKPLTWVLGIVFVGYLFIANCECGEGSICPLNNGFNIGFEEATEEVKQEIRVEIKVEEEVKLLILLTGIPSVDFL